MATTQTNSFLNTDASKKGTAGEKLVKDILERKGYVVYEPTTKNKPHGYDMILYKDHKYQFAAEVKTKVSSADFDETGIEKYVFERYQKLCAECNLPLFLIFVDERLGKVYGNYFSELCKEIQIKAKQYGKEIIERTYPKLIWRKGGSTPTYFFHLSQFETIEQLRPLEIDYLKLFHVSSN